MRTLTLRVRRLGQGGAIRFLPFPPSSSPRWLRHSAGCAPARAGCTAVLRNSASGRLSKTCSGKTFRLGKTCLSMATWWPGRSPSTSILEKATGFFCSRRRIPPSSCSPLTSSLLFALQRVWSFCVAGILARDRPTAMAVATASRRDGPTQGAASFLFLGRQQPPVSFSLATPVSFAWRRSSPATARPIWPTSSWRRWTPPPSIPRAILLFFSGWQQPPVSFSMLSLFGFSQTRVRANVSVWRR